MGVDKYLKIDISRGFMRLVIYTCTIEINDYCSVLTITLYFLVSDKVSMSNKRY